MESFSMRSLITLLCHQIFNMPLSLGILSGIWIHLCHVFIPIFQLQIWVHVIPPKISIHLVVQTFICTMKYRDAFAYFIILQHWHLTHDALTISLLRQNDDATSFWRNDDVIIASCAGWDPLWTMRTHLLSGVPDYLVATRFRVAVICPIIQVPHCIRVFFYFVWFVFINHIFQFYYELCTYCNILDIYLS